ncbi:hypothetical protein B0H14DRAFT_2571056 [Mycena olivaceomarginata]|nr:hypothetical protein B0H14DRAFT_2571056 [Mycena olivaceomarginata]
MPWVNSLKHLLPVVVMASSRNELSHRTALLSRKLRTRPRGTTSKELKAELAIFMAEPKTTSSGVVRGKPEEQVKITRYSSLSLFPIAYSPLFGQLKPPRAGPSSQKKTTTDEKELDGVEMVSLEVRIEPGIQPDALEPENDVDSDKASPSEPNLDVDGEGDVAPPQLSTRRFPRKRGASKTHEDAPVRKSGKTGAAVAPEPSSS